MSVWAQALEGGLDPSESPAVGLLQKDIASGRIAHAYLFSGVAGSLPLDTAIAFGAAMVCPQQGCGSCEACLRVLHRAHPDVEVIEPAGVQLLVEQVREAVRAASRAPVAGPRRVIIVAGADRMNPTSQNAFLKALEEPPASTTIVLLAPSPEALLETVRSRCREVTFRSPPPAEVASMLAAAGIDEDDARYIARVGGGLERATALATDQDARTLRDEVVERALLVQRDPGDALEAAEWLAASTKLLRDRIAEEHRSSQEAFGQWYKETKRTADDRLRREQRRAEQDALEGSIDDVASVLRDLLVVLSDPDGDVLNERARADLVSRAARLGPGAEPRVIACLSDVEAARRRLRGNANVLLTLEEVFLSLYRHLR